MATILCNLPTGLYLTWPAATSPSLAGIWPPGADPFISLQGSNAALNAPNVQAPDSLNGSGSDGQGSRFGITQVNSLLWANARASGSGVGGVGTLITNLINSGNLVVVTP
jgi:hypothetical protein